MSRSIAKLPILLGLLICAAAFGYGQGVQSKAKTAPPALEAEARALVARFWSRAVMCGDSIYVGSKESLWEYKGMSLNSARVDADQVSAADRLNGVQWFGHVTLSYSAYRNRFPAQEGKWGPWSEWRNPPYPIITYVVKKSGTWSIVHDTVLAGAALETFDHAMAVPQTFSSCADIPKN